MLLGFVVFSVGGEGAARGDASHRHLARATTADRHGDRARRNRTGRGIPAGVPAKERRPDALLTPVRVVPLLQQFDWAVLIAVPWLATVFLWRDRVGREATTHKAPATIATYCRQ